MTPPQLNALITAITNSLYCSLNEKDFFSFALAINMLSKQMLSMSEIKSLCRLDKKLNRD